MVLTGAPTMHLKVYDITGEYAIAADNGQEICDRILPLLQDNQAVELDFGGVNVFASAFFNVAIGQLLKHLSPDTLNQLLNISNLNATGSELLATIIANAKEYYSNQQYQAAVDTVIEEYAVSFEA